MSVQSKESESPLIPRLRDEANFVKDCFTRFSFQTLAISAVVLGVIAKFQADIPFVALASILVIALNLSVARIGTYKYATANRHFGYELHLNRIKLFNYSSERREAIESIGWEEAMCAWRVVQATLFEHLYYTHRLIPNYLKKRHKEKRKQGLWFEPSTLISSGADYHSGRYLKTMHSVLHFIAFIYLIPLAVMSYQLHISDEYNEYYFWSALVITFSTSLLIIHRIFKNSARRKLLEKGLLSIHSCSLMWHAVITAHLRAVTQTLSENSSLKKYTYNLSLEALGLKKKALDIHTWIVENSPTNKN